MRNQILHRTTVTAFSLVELVMVISLIGILAVVVTPILSRPFMVFKDQQVRSSLVDRAQSALSHIAREARRAVPNSVRITGSSVEMMPISFAGRYPLHDIPTEATGLGLTPNQVDATLSLFSNIPANLTGQRLIVNPVNSVLLYSAAAGASALGIITPASTTLSMIDNGNQDQITLSSGFLFDPVGIGSPSKRLFASRGPISFVCNASLLNFYSNYAVSAAQPAIPSGANISLVTDAVESCQFRYNAGAAQRNGLLTLEITVVENGERVRLVQQVHVENTP